MTYKTTFAKRLTCRIAASLMAVLMAASTLTFAQSATVNSVVPNVVNYSGLLVDANGKALSGINGVTFYLYKDAEAGAPLWMETQNIQADSRGHFSAKLGSASEHGLPADLFASGEARWLGVQAQGQAEQPRVLLLSVPYALKAADAETLGGLPASAFITAKSVNESSTAASASTTGKSDAGAPQAAAKTVTTPSPYGNAGLVPLWTGTTPSHTLGNSLISQSGGAVSVAGSMASSGTISGSQGLFSPAGAANAVVGANNAAGFSAVGGISNNTSAVAYGTSGESLSTTGIGVIGFGRTFSKLFTSIVGHQPFGVVGDAANVIGTGVPIGVYGIADGGVGIAGENNSTTQPAGLFRNFDTTAGDLVFEALGPSGHCTIDTRGDLACTGSKSAVVNLPDNRWVGLYAVQSPENWFEDFGSGTLTNGTAAIKLDPAFAQTVNTNVAYHVFITPKGDSEGLYVTKETAAGFEVHEQRGGRSNIAFDYRIVGRRLGYENIRLEDATEAESKVAAMRHQTPKISGVNAGLQLPASAHGK